MTEQARDPEKRRFPRIAKDVSVEITRIAYPLPPGPEATGRATNISAGGIRCLAERAYSPGDTLSLAIRLPGLGEFQRPHSLLVDATAQKPLTAVGEVVWCAPAAGGGSEIGLRFVDIYEDDARALARYLEHEADAADGE